MGVCVGVWCVRVTSQETGALGYGRRTGERILALLWQTRGGGAKLAVWPRDSSWICLSLRLPTCHQAVELDNNLKLSSRSTVTFGVCTLVCMWPHVLPCTKTLEQMKPNLGLLHSCFDFKMQSPCLHFQWHYFGSGGSSLNPCRGGVRTKYSLLENCLFVTKVLKLKDSL